MKRQSIQFVEAKRPIRDPITKFGGQPVWIQEPQWPISASTGRPMRFICQVALSKEIFGATEPQMAYVFMTDEAEYVEGTWEPDGGENAVILQPGTPTMPVRGIENGPTLYRMVKKLFRTNLVPEPCEFGIVGPFTDDPEYISESERAKLADPTEEAGSKFEGGNKIGGSPSFLQGEEFPDDGTWTLILQLDSARVPFSINFGDAGVGYAFLSADGKSAKFLWQCC